MAKLNEQGRFDPVSLTRIYMLKVPGECTEPGAP